MEDLVRFVDPWTLLLPDRFPSVLAVAGSGGRTTLMLRLWRHYRERGATVLWASTADAAPPFDLLPARCGPQPQEVAARLAEGGQAWVGGAATGGGRYAGLEPETLEALRRATRPDVLLVDAHASCATPLRRDGMEPRWPRHAQIAFLVAPLGAISRPWGPTTVAGVDEIEVGPEGEPRRITVDDVLESLLVEGGWIDRTPEDALALPFLTGLAALRDLDAMFDLVQRLWTHPRVKGVCLADLLGDERRDAADQAGLDPARALGPWSGERVYAVYPSALDAEGPERGPE